MTLQMSATQDPPAEWLNVEAQTAKDGTSVCQRGRNMVLHGGDTLTSGAFSVLDSVTV